MPYSLNSVYRRDGRGAIFLNGELVACSIDWDSVDYVAWQIERDLLKIRSEALAA